MTKEAPQVSAPFAAQQLIARLGKSEDVVKIGPATGLLTAQANHLTNQLEKLGVQLTMGQLQKLEAGERENYKKEILKADRAKVLLYWGSVEVARLPDRIVLKFEADGPVKIVGTGMLKNDGLGDHLSLGLRSTKQSVHLSIVSIYGVIENREQDAETVRIVITPYAIW